MAVAQLLGRPLTRSSIRVSRWSSHGGCLRSAFPQEALDFRGRSRLAEEEALEFIAAFRGQTRELLLRFHALGRCLDTQAAAQSDHGADDRKAVFLSGQITNEGLIDLDPVEREAAQIAE